MEQQPTQEMAGTPGAFATCRVCDAVMPEPEYVELQGRVECKTCRSAAYTYVDCTGGADVGFQVTTETLCSRRRELDLSWPLCKVCAGETGENESLGEIVEGASERLKAFAEEIRPCVTNSWQDYLGEETAGRSSEVDTPGLPAGPDLEEVEWSDRDAEGENEADEEEKPQAIQVHMFPDVETPMVNKSVPAVVEVVEAQGSDQVLQGTFPEVDLAEGITGYPAPTPLPDLVACNDSAEMPPGWLTQRIFANGEGTVSMFRPRDPISPMYPMPVDNSSSNKYAFADLDSAMPAGNSDFPTTTPPFAMGQQMSHVHNPNSVSHPGAAFAFGQQPTAQGMEPAGTAAMGQTPFPMWDSPYGGHPGQLAFTDMNRSAPMYSNHGGRTQPIPPWSDQFASPMGCRPSGHGPVPHPKFTGNYAGYATQGGGRADFGESRGAYYGHYNAHTF